MIEQKMCRVLAYLMREEGVTPEAVEHAVASARDMQPGQSVTLEGDEAAPMRREFLFAQLRRLGA